MMVIYPGPAVVGQARTDPQSYPVLGVDLKPGENDIPQKAAEILLRQGHVSVPHAPTIATPAPEPSASIWPERSPRQRGRRQRE